jgi:hypothetical protein
MKMFKLSWRNPSNEEGEIRSETETEEAAISRFKEAFPDAVITGIEELTSFFDVHWINREMDRGHSHRSGISKVDAKTLEEARTQGEKFWPEVTKVEPSTLAIDAEYFDRLSRHDWFYEYSDDGRVYRKGRDAEASLKADARDNPWRMQALVLWQEHISAVHGGNREHVIPTAVEVEEVLSCTS